VLARSSEVFAVAPDRVVAVKSDEKHLEGVRGIAGWRWSAKELSLYQSMHAETFANTKKFAVAADPSTYSGEKTLVSVLIDVETKSACFPPVQVLPASNMFSPLDHPDMTDRMKLLAYEGRIERSAAYREWQALSNAIAKTAGVSLDDFRIPDGILWKPVGPGQVRTADTSNPTFDVPLVANAVDGRAATVAPHRVLGNLRQLTLCLDSGSVGRAAASFAKNHLGLNLFVVWDKYHRLIRDLKLAAEKAAGGQLYR
jgi:hypothetical protein